MIELKLVSIHMKESPQAMGLATAMLKARLERAEGFGDKVETVLCDFYLDRLFSDKQESNLSEAALKEPLLQKPESMSPALSEVALFLAQKLATEQTAYIGFSVYLWNQPLVLEVTRQVKKINPLITLFAGGAQASAAPQELFRRGEFDFIICGEGEETLDEAMKRIWRGDSLEGLAGVVLAEQKGHCVPAPVVKNLDSLPSPWLSGVIDPAAFGGILWELSRGCVFHCMFCYEGRGASGVRYYSIERLRRELELFEKKGVRQIFVLDATFNQRRARAKELLTMILEVAPQIHYTFEVRTEFLDEEMVELFSRLNCTLQIGLQSSRREVVLHLNRKFDPEKYARKIAMLNEAGISFGLDLIYALPEDNFAGFCESVDYALTLQPNNLDIFPLAVLPDTGFYDLRQKYSLESLDEAPYTVISTPGFSPEEMTQAARLCEAVDIFYNRGRASGWFFMVTETVGWSPSSFLRRFAADYELSGQGFDLSQEEILSLQLSFTEKIFQETGHAMLFGVMRDIISLHHAFSESLFAGPAPAASPALWEDATKDEREVRPRLYSHVFLISLGYDPDELMNVGEYNLEEFLENFEPFPCEAVVYNSYGEIKAQLIDHNWRELLENCDGRQTLFQLIQAPRDAERQQEMRNILDFALHEGMLAFD